MPFVSFVLLCLQPKMMPKATTANKNARIFAQMVSLYLEYNIRTHMMRIYALRNFRALRGRAQATKAKHLTSLAFT